MRVLSRELIVGFLLVLALVATACVPVQPPSETVVTTNSDTVVESEAVTDTATLVESALITESTADTATTIITATSVITTTVIVTDVVVTDTVEVTEGVAASVTEESAPVDPAVMAAGMVVYRAQYCGVCHTLDAAETRGTFGPPHNGMGAIAAGHLADGTYNGAATTPAEYIRESIVDPQAFIVPGYATTSHRMPSYAHLDAASLDALVAFLLAQ